MIFYEILSGSEFSVEPEYGVLEKYHDGTPKNGESVEVAGLWRTKFLQMDGRFGLIAALERVKSIAAGCPVYVSPDQVSWLVPHIQDLIHLFRKVGLENDLWNPDCKPTDFCKAFVSRYADFGSLVLSRAVFAMGFSKSLIFGDGIFYPEGYIGKFCQKKCTYTEAILSNWSEVSCWALDATAQTHFKSKMTKDFYRGSRITAVIPSGQRLSAKIGSKTFCFEEGELLNLQLIRFHTTTPSAFVFFTKEHMQSERQQTRHEITFACASPFERYVGRFVPITYLIPESWVVHSNGFDKLGAHYHDERHILLMRMAGNLLEKSPDERTNQKFIEIEKVFYNRF